MSNYKSYTFFRLISHFELEFYSIIGLKEPHNFSEDWDGREPALVGYLVVHKIHELKQLKHFVYLIKDKVNWDEINKYIYQFANSMISLDLDSYSVEYKLCETNIYQRVVDIPNFMDHVRQIVGKDIPEQLLNKIKNV